MRPEVVPFEPWHLAWLELQPSQRALSSTLTLAHGSALQAAGPCYSLFVGPTVVACAGVIEIWKGRAQVWSLLSQEFPRYHRAVHTSVTRFLRGYRTRRLECIVDPNHPEARRWAEHLGFVAEGRMTAYTPDGLDQVMYARIDLTWQ